MKLIQTDKFSGALRRKGIDVENKRLLITDFSGSQQEKDFSLPSNCNGLGRIRHFHRKPGTQWVNPLPIDPALKSLNKDLKDQITAQVFQNAICNWRCWYCFVDFELLAGNPKHGKWVSAEDLVTLYLENTSLPDMIDLSGGQPDLTPEWVLWMVEALHSKGLSDRVYLWSDDNLSNDYFFKYLDTKQIDRILQYPHYGRVACFKGVDAESFRFNTMAEEDRYQYQFQLFRQLLNTGMDLYAYVTLTIPDETNLKDKMQRFIDNLQNVHPNLPLRTVPLKVDIFSPVHSRMDETKHKSIKNQQRAIEYWQEMLTERFSKDLLNQRITDIPLN